MSFTNYIKTLNLAAPETPDVAFLSEYTQAHLARYTFNNLAVLLHETISLDSADIFEKVVRRQRGGYCFEHNKIAYETLSSLGYSAQIAMARVLNNHDRPVPRTHRITLVEVADELYLVDVGFGGACPSAPISLMQTGPQAAGHEHYQVNQLDNGEYELVLLTTNGPFLLYRFDLAVYTEADCDMGHFYSHKHPNAVFVNNFVVSRKTPTTTFTIINHRFTQRTGYETYEVILDSEATLRQHLTEALTLNIEPEISAYLFERHIKPKYIKEIEEGKVS